MKASIGPITRIHEWAADRFSFVQYPDVRSAVLNREKRQPLRFKTAMPLYMRFALFCFGLLLLMVSGTLLVVFGVALWSLVGR